MLSRRSFCKSAFALGASGLWLPKAQVAVFRRKQPASTAASPTPDILWWKFSNGSGTAITAEVGPNGTTDAGWVTGQSGSGYALEFDGSTDEASSDSAVTYGTNIITVSLWASCDSPGTVSGVFAESSASFADSSNPHCWLIYNDEADTGRIYAAIHGSGATGTHRAEYIATPSGTGWHHYLFVIDNSTDTGDLKIFLDGIEQITTVGTNTKGASSTGNMSVKTLYVGARNLSSLRHDGKIDDLRIYSGDQSASVAAIYADSQ